MINHERNSLGDEVLSFVDVDEYNYKYWLGHAWVWIPESRYHKIGTEWCNEMKKLEV